jgi:hydrogenase maturation protein HypF
MFAQSLRAGARIAVQHHRAHIASALAEREELGRRVLGIAFDGTGYGDDGTIWGGEFFAGSVRDGFERVAHLRPARLPGGDAAARFPAQAAAGFMAAIPDAGDLTGPPFNLPSRYRLAATLAATGMRSFTTTSVGRLFDSVAALTGFTRPISYEGQAAVWLEHLASSCSSSDVYPLAFDGRELDWRPALDRIVQARRTGETAARMARAFHLGLADSTAAAAAALAGRCGVSDVVLSGGVFQNALLADELTARLVRRGFHVIAHSSVPPNDGGISLGQAALASTMHGNQEAL